MKKASWKIVSSIALLFVCFSGVAFASNSSKINVFFEDLKYVINGQVMKPDSSTQGFIYKNTTYVPLRFVSEALGQNVRWNNQSKTITLENNNMTGTELNVVTEENEKLKQEIGQLKNEISALKKQSGSNEVVWKEFKHGNITLKFTESAYEKYSYLETEYNQLTEVLNTYFGIKDVNNPVTMYIQRQTDHTQLSNSGSFYESGAKISVLNPDDNYNYTGDAAVRFVFIHELAHVYQDAKWGFDKLGEHTGYQSYWILEGQADYVAKKLAGHTQYGENTDPSGVNRDAQYYYDELHYRNGVNGWKKLNWNAIDTFAELGSYRDEYFAFESIIHFVNTSYTHEHYLKFIDYVSQGLSFNEATRKAFNKSDIELMKEYKAFYKL